METAGDTHPRRAGAHHKQRPAPVDVLAAERTLYLRSFREFVRDAFEVVVGGDAHAELVRLGRRPPRFVPGWHIDAIADHLQAVAELQIRRLLINVPPVTCKSTETCVLWPDWLWARDASLRFMFSSYNENFTKRDCRKAKALLLSEWYRAHFPEVELKRDPDTVLEHHTTAGGERHGASPGSGVTGQHVHGIVEDDPIKQQDVSSKSARDAAWRYHSETLGSRLLPEGNWRVLIMQRQHEDDPAGRILARGGIEDGDSYVHLCLPMEFEPKRRCQTRLPFADPRQEEGELLWPARLNAGYVAEQKVELGSYGYATQDQQRPAPEEGGIVKRAWWRRYMTLPDDLVDFLVSVDCTFKDTGKSYVVFQAWARRVADAYLLDQYRDKVDFTETVRALVAFCARWPQASLKLIEDKANGPAVISHLKSVVPGLVAVEPQGGKQARLSAVSPFIESGNVYIPHSASWVDGYIEELSLFPNAANDDQVDATSQALQRLLGGRKQWKILPFNLSEVGVRENPWEM